MMGFRGGRSGGGSGYSAQSAFNERVAARQARADRRLQDQTFINNAQMAVDHLWTLGPEGQQWANRIASDPHAGMAMLEQYGGVNGVDLMLRRANAANQEAQATGRVVSPMELEAWRQQGVQGYGLFSDALSAQADAEKTAAEAENQLLMNTLLGGGSGATNPMDATDAMDLGRIQLALALQSGNAGDVGNAEQRMLFGPNYDAAKAQTFLENRRKEFEGLTVLKQRHEQALTADVTKPLDVLNLLTNFQKSIDEGVVRQDDVNIITQATGSTLENLIAAAKHFKNARQAFPENMGRRLMNGVMRIYLAKANAFSDQYASWEEFLADEPEYARNKMLPYRNLIEELRTNIDKGWTPLRMARDGESDEVIQGGAEEAAIFMDTPIGETYEFNGVTKKRISQTESEEVVN